MRFGVGERGKRGHNASQGWPRDHSVASGAPNDRAQSLSIREATASEYGFALV